MQKQILIALIVSIAIANADFSYKVDIKLLPLLWDKNGLNGKISIELHADSKSHRVQLSPE